MKKPSIGRTEYHGAHSDDLDLSATSETRERATTLMSKETRGKGTGKKKRLARHGMVYSIARTDTGKNDPCEAD